MTAKPFQPPRGGRDSQSLERLPVPSAYWQPPEAVERSEFWRYRHEGLFLGWSGDTPIGVADDRHLVLIAGARAGKTSTLLLPNLRLYPGSTIVIDPKGELARETAAHRRKDLGHAVHVLDPWGVSGVKASTFDPLDEIRDRPRDLWGDDAALIAEGLIQDQGESNSHWTDSGRNLVRGLILWMLDGGDPEGCSLARLPRVLAAAASEWREDGEPAPDAPLTLWEAMRDHAGRGDDVEAIIRNTGAGMLGTSGRERASILSTARNQLAFLESAKLESALASSDLRLSALASVPTTIFLCLPAARMGTHARWLRLILNLAVAALEDAKTRPALPILFMLEEFAALGHMRALEQAAAYMAGFGVKLWVVLQDLTQLKRHYKEGWESFLGNAGVLVAFGNADQTTLDYLSKRLGETAVYIEETHATGTSSAAGGDTGVRRNFQRVPLLAPQEVALAFGRVKMRALVQAADGPPIALTRRFLDDPLFSEVLPDD